MTDENKMSSRERSDLQTLAKMNARVAKADVDAVVADRVAVFEREMARDWSAQELQVADLVAEAQQQIDAINERITAACDEQGIRPELRPRMISGLYKSPRLSTDREREVRRMARAEFDAAGKRAKVEIDRQTAAVCGEIIGTGLSSDQARDLLARVDRPEQLVPTYTVAELEQRIGGGK